MLPYYITFFLSCLFCYLGERSIPQIEYTNDLSQQLPNNHYKMPRLKLYNIKLYHVCFFICVMLVSLLAGMRDYTVGTDIRSYGNPLFYWSESYDSYFAFKNSFSNIEPLYLLLVYVSSSISSEPHMLYFLTGLIIYSFILAGLYKVKSKISITIAWACFLFLLYGDTYNAMRQSLAIAVGFWAFYFLTKKKYLFFAVGIVCAFMFHNTSIIFVVIGIIYLILIKNNSFWLKILLILATVCSILLFNQALIWLINHGVLHSKMDKYLISNSTGLSTLAILNRIPFLALILFYKKKFWNYGNSNGRISPFESENECDFYITMLFLEMFTVEMSAFVGSLYRIALFFVPFRCIAYSRFCVIFKSKEKIMYSLFMLMYIIVIFIYQNQFKGNNDIYPYVWGG